MWFVVCCDWLAEFGKNVWAESRLTLEVPTPTLALLTWELVFDTHYIYHPKVDLPLPFYAMFSNTVLRI